MDTVRSIPSSWKCDFFSQTLGAVKWRRGPSVKQVHREVQKLLTTETRP